MRSYELALAAESDLGRILEESEDRFGEVARKRYEILLITAFKDVAAAPERAGSRPLPAVFGFAGRIYHLRHSRDRARTPWGVVQAPRHFLIYRQRMADLVQIARILHDAMDLRRHLPKGRGR